MTDPDIQIKIERRPGAMRKLAEAVRKASRSMWRFSRLTENLNCPPGTYVRLNPRIIYRP